MKRALGPQVGSAVVVMLGLLLTGCADSSDGSGTAAESETSASPADDTSSSASTGPRHLVEDDSNPPLEPGTYQMSISKEISRCPRGACHCSEWVCRSGRLVRRVG